MNKYYCNTLAKFQFFVYIYFNYKSNINFLKIKLRIYQSSARVHDVFIRQNSPKHLPTRDRSYNLLKYHLGIKGYSQYIIVIQLQALLSIYNIYQLTPKEESHQKYIGVTNCRDEIPNNFG